MRLSFWKIVPFEAHATNEAFLVNLAKRLETAINLHRTALPGDVERRAEVRLYPVLENTPSVSAF